MAPPPGRARARRDRTSRARATAARGGRREAALVAGGRREQHAMRGQLAAAPPRRRTRRLEFDRRALYCCSCRRAGRAGRSRDPLSPPHRAADAVSGKNDAVAICFGGCCGAVGRRRVSECVSAFDPRSMLIQKYRTEPHSTQEELGPSSDPRTPRPRRSIKQKRRVRSFKRPEADE